MSRKIFPKTKKDKNAERFSVPEKGWTRYNRFIRKTCARLSRETEKENWEKERNSKIKRKYVKSILAATLAGVMTLGLAACGSDSTDNGSSSTGSSTSASRTDAEHRAAADRCLYQTGTDDRFRRSAGSDDEFETEYQNMLDTLDSYDIKDIDAEYDKVYKEYCEKKGTSIEDVNADLYK